MKYTKVRISADEEELELISAMLHDKGIGGIEMIEPSTYNDLYDKQNSYDWDYIDPTVKNLGKVSPCMIFYTEDTLTGIDLLDEILQEIRVFDVTEVEIAGVDDEDWKHKWKEHFKPTRITDRITVLPSWETYNASDDEIIIEIDPGMAFGTGTHPTTTLCLKLLEQFIVEGESTVLDIGCGSGILTIAASKLGAKEVTGVEIDPTAVRVAEKNIEKNDVKGQIRIVEGDLTKGLDYTADIIVANLMAELIMKLGMYVPDNLKQNGTFISSGILLEKKEEVITTLKSRGFQILCSPEDEEWCAIAAKYYSDDKDKVEQ